jgi:3'-phosphoadenosine 5'-phosphosulfate sulfotransferase (PAPS reductase)/FAD synthetase
VTRDHFRLDGPTIINVSGGRTSALMLRRYLDANGGALPPDVHAVYANTGRERPETLDFVAAITERWGVDITWIERDRATGYREVTYDTAARDGEPFADLITDKHYLPNAVARFCTQDLKIRPAAAFMRARGYSQWTSVIGLRFDEARRVANVRSRDHGDWDIACPLYDARVTSDDVLGFWRAQPFDLALQSYQGNCDLCFLKGRARRERIMREAPHLVDWWATQEARIGGRFHAHEPGYARTLDAVRRLPMLPMDLDGADDHIACNCTDRRKPSRCTCGKRRGMGHALSCAMLMGAERGPRVIYADSERAPLALDGRAA